MNKEMTLGRVEKALTCNFACLLACGCGPDSLFNAVRMMRHLSDEDLEILEIRLCASCAIPVEGGGGGGVAPPTPTECAAEFRATFCTADKIARAGTLITGLRGLMSAAALLEIEIEHLPDLIEKLEDYREFCASGSDEQFANALAGFCLLRQLVNLGSFGSQMAAAGAAGAALLALLRRMIASTETALLDQCCAAAVASGTIPASSLPGPVPRPTGAGPGGVQALRPASPGTVLASRGPTAGGLRSVGGTTTQYYTPQNASASVSRVVTMPVTTAQIIRATRSGR